MEEAKAVKKHTIKELAQAAKVTPAAVYSAVKKGHIPAIQYGSTYRLTEGAFRYHAANGWGKHVPPFGAVNAPD